MVNGPGNLPEFHKAPLVNPVPKNVPKPERKFVPPPEAKVEPAAQVTISPRAQELRNLAPKIQATPEIRPSRVEEVRVKLGQGNPQALNAKIAEKLLTEI
jgi:hypothetical protein